MSKEVGTRTYMAPEVVSGAYDFSADIFSLGCVLFFVLTGCMMDHTRSALAFPARFQYEDPPGVHERILEVFPTGSAAHEALASMTHPLPHLRPTAAEALALPFFATAPEAL